AYFDLVVTGTLWRYLIANFRYFIFTIVPPLQLIGLAALALFAALVTARYLDLSWSIKIAWVSLGSGCLFLILLKFPGRWWRLQQALDDWILLHDYVYGARSDLFSRIEQFA